MPITSSAKKALRASKHKRVYNIERRDSLNDVVKAIKKLVKDKKVKDAEKLLPNAYQAIDKAAKRGIIKKNTANRKKSRLVKAMRKEAK